MLLKLLTVDYKTKILFKTEIISTGPEQTIIGFFTSTGNMGIDVICIQKSI